MSRPTQGGDCVWGLENEAKPKSSSNNKALSRWYPDIYVQSFVPKIFIAINQCQAMPVLTPPLEGIDFHKYVATLYGQYFRKALPTPWVSTWEYSTSTLPRERLEISNYEGHFQHCLMSEIKSQEIEIRGFDIFGAKLERLDRVAPVFTLLVPGLREDSPSVNFGDNLILRQWIEGPCMSLQLGLYGWLPKSPTSPGFTGYEISAVVVGVDKMVDTLHIRAFGLFDLPQVRCNVMFVKPARFFQSLQRAVTDVAHELRELTSNGYRVDPSNTNATLRSLPVENRIQKQSISPESNNWLQHMLFPKEEYGIVQEGLPSAKFPQKWFDTALNYEQKKAVDAITTANYGQLCYLINGPPGTGKTKTICEAVTQLGKYPNSPGSMLLCAPSKQAADTLAQRLSKHFGPSDMLRLNHFSRTFAEVPIDLMMYCFVEDNIFHIPPINKLMAFKIVVTTCQDADILVQARVSNRDLFNLHRGVTTTLFPHQNPTIPSPALHWSALIIDEAAQATEPDTLIPLSVVTPPLDAPREVVHPVFVMAGDQYQLGPRTYDRSTTLHVSLFERLSHELVYSGHPLARKTMRSNARKEPTLRPPFTNLSRNYRSHPAILAVPSSLFYSNTLIPETIDSQIVSNWNKWSLSRCGWPVQFVCNGGSDECEDVQDSAHGWYNKSEALKAIHCAQGIIQKLNLPDQRDICIMSPFWAQVRLLRKTAREHNLHNVNIGPMEAFQGLESRVVIVCTTRARLRFLADDKIRGLGVIDEPKKFNVSVTRAKEGLVVIGNPWVLATDRCWLAFMRFCWRNGLQREDPVLHTKMYNTKEGKVNNWTYKDGEEDVGVDKRGLEAALLYKEREQWQGSIAAKRFLGSHEDEQWKSGVEAEEALGHMDRLTLDNRTGGA